MCINFSHEPHKCQRKINNSKTDPSIVSAIMPGEIHENCQNYNNYDSTNMEIPEKIFGGF